MQGELTKREGFRIQDPEFSCYWVLHLVKSLLEFNEVEMDPEYFYQNSVLFSKKFW